MEQRPVRPGRAFVPSSTPTTNVARSLRSGITLPSGRLSRRRVDASARGTNPIMAAPQNTTRAPIPSSVGVPSAGPLHPQGPRNASRRRLNGMVSTNPLAVLSKFTDSYTPTRKHTPTQDGNLSETGAEVDNQLARIRERLRGAASQDNLLRENLDFAIQARHMRLKRPPSGSRYDVSSYKGGSEGKSEQHTLADKLTEFSDQEISAVLRTLSQYREQLQESTRAPPPAVHTSAPTNTLGLTSSDVQIQACCLRWGLAALQSEMVQVTELGSERDLVCLPAATVQRLLNTATRSDSGPSSTTNARTRSPSPTPTPAQTTSTTDSSTTGSDEGTDLRSQIRELQRALAEERDRSARSVAKVEATMGRRVRAAAMQLSTAQTDLAGAQRRVSELERLVTRWEGECTNVEKERTALQRWVEQQLDLLASTIAEGKMRTAAEDIKRTRSIVGDIDQVTQALKTHPKSGGDGGDSKLLWHAGVEDGGNVVQQISTSSESREKRRERTLIGYVLQLKKQVQHLTERCHTLEERLDDSNEAKQKHMDALADTVTNLRSGAGGWESSAVSMFKQLAEVFRAELDMCVQFGAQRVAELEAQLAAETASHAKSRAKWMRRGRTSGS